MRSNNHFCELWLRRYTVHLCLYHPIQICTVQILRRPRTLSKLQIYLGLCQVRWCMYRRRAGSSVCAISTSTSRSAVAKRLGRRARRILATRHIATYGTLRHSFSIWVRATTMHPSHLRSQQLLVALASQCGPLAVRAMIRATCTGTCLLYERWGTVRVQYRCVHRTGHQISVGAPPVVTKLHGNA